MDLKGDDYKHSQKELDLEFQRILRIIKPYIPCIMNNYYLTLYRMWLEKLSELALHEKEERNCYLIELCHQIQNGVLEKPFTQLPPPGPLPPLRDRLQNNKVHTQRNALKELTPVRPPSCQNTILKGINTLAKSEKGSHSWSNETHDKFSRNIPETIQVLQKGANNSEIPTCASYRKRNSHAVLRQNSVQNNIIDDLLVEFSKSPNSVPATQFLSESNTFQEKLVGTDLQPYYTNSNQCPQTQQHDNPNKCYSQTQKHQEDLVREDLHPCTLNPKQCSQKQHHDYYLQTQEQCVNHTEKTFYQHVRQQRIQKEHLENVTRKLRKIKPEPKPINIHIRNNNDGDCDGDSSWYDLTDVSSTTVTRMSSGGLDNVAPTLNHPEPDKNDSQNYLYAMYDARITDLMNIITELQKQNLSLNEDVAKYERDLSLRNTKAETSIYTLAGEVKSLKSGLQELTAIKKALKNSHFTASSQWQSTVNTLNKELCISQNQNVALKAEIIKLKKELEELCSQKQKDDAPLEQKLRDTHAKEIRMLKQTYAKHVASIEKKFTQTLTERENAFNQRQRTLQTIYERKISDIISEYDNVVNCRNAAIQRLENAIKCERMHEEVRDIRSEIVQEHSNGNGDTNLEKITVLQKCLYKMDNLFKKSEKKYNKKIAKLKHEIEMKDKAIQIQLTTQRAELLATTNTKRQVETDATVMLLEERYRKLLESQQAHFLADKQNDAKLISDLRAMLARTNVDS